ncbi:unnamed protein product [Prunus brigantina]
MKYLVDGNSLPHLHSRLLFLLRTNVYLICNVVCILLHVHFCKAYTCSHLVMELLVYHICYSYSSLSESRDTVFSLLRCSLSKMLTQSLSLASFAFLLKQVL